MPAFPRNAPPGRSTPGTVSLHQLSHEVPGKAWGEYQKAHKLLDAGKTAEAESHFEKAIAIDNEFVDAYNDLAAVYLVQATTQPAIERLTAATRVDPECAVAYSNLTVAYLMEGKAAEAEVTARRSADLDRTGARARMILGLTLVIRNKFTAETEGLLSKVTADYPQVLLLLGRTKAHRGDFAGAEAEIRQYLNTSAAPAGRDLAEQWLATIQTAEKQRKESESASVRSNGGLPPRFWGVFCLATLLNACHSEPDVFPIPPQRRSALAAPFNTQLLSMGDPTAESHIIKDIALGPVESWRWTGQEPRLRFYLVDAEGLKYHIEFTIADVTFKDTGPVTLTFLVNDKPIGTQRYDKAGPQTWEHPVEPSLLKPVSDNTIGVSVDKIWVAPQDHSHLGVILSAIGLVR